MSADCAANIGRRPSTAATSQASRVVCVVVLMVPAPLSGRAVRRRVNSVSWLGRGCKPSAVRVEERGAEAAEGLLARQLDDRGREDAASLEGGRRLGGEG